MKDSFTFFNDLILYYGNEDTDEHEDSVDDDHLESSKCEGACPDQRIIDNIMNYSRALTILRTKRSGNISLLMN